MEVAAFVVSVLALLGTGVGFLVARRDRRRDRAYAERDARDARDRADRAQATADQATDAAERYAAAAERMAQALEEQAARAAHEAAVPEAAWALEHFQGDSYLLTNTGTAPAYDVDVDTADLLSRPPQGDPWPRAEVRPHEPVKFIAARMMNTKDDTVTVTWAEQQGSPERRTWRRPLPPRPPTASVHLPQGRLPTGAQSAHGRSGGRTA